VAGDLDNMGRRQPWGNLGPFLLYLSPETGNLILFAGVISRVEFINPAFKGKNVLFKLIKVFFFAHRLWRGWGLVYLIIL
jgi:hypothetical protein